MKQISVEDFHGIPGNERALKAIETSYNGYRFRSRLEARWAVFFDTQGIAYEYEKEGFDLDGIFYLPDFWLPRVEMWAEVKGTKFTPEEQEKCKRLCKATDQPVLMLAGPPDYKAYDGWIWFPWANPTQPVLTDYRLDMMYYFDERRFYSSCGGDEGDWLRDDRRYVEAVNAARAARFEHGKKP